MQVVPGRNCLSRIIISAGTKVSLPLPRVPPFWIGPPFEIRSKVSTLPGRLFVLVCTSINANEERQGKKMGQKFEVSSFCKVLLFQIQRTVTFRLRLYSFEPPSWSSSKALPRKQSWAERLTRYLSYAMQSPLGYGLGERDPANEQ